MSDPEFEKWWTAFADKPPLPWTKAAFAAGREVQAERDAKRIDENADVCEKMPTDTKWNIGNVLRSISGSIRRAAIRAKEET